MAELMLEVSPYQEYHIENRGNSSSTGENRDNSAEKNNTELLFKTGEVPSVRALKHLLTDDQRAIVFAGGQPGRLMRLLINPQSMYFRRFLNDKNLVVRLEAVAALGKIGGPIAIETLMKSLNDESYYVCRKAAKLLIELDKVPLNHIPLTWST
jgi:HEAT repeat protein